MVVTPDQSTARIMRRLSLHGMTNGAWKRNSWQYEVLGEGFKYNFNDIQAAIGIHQLRKLDSTIAIRHEIAATYHQLLSSVSEIALPNPSVKHKTSWHLFSIRLNLKTLRTSRDYFVEKLKDMGVSTSVHFTPIPLHPYFNFLLQESRNSCPRAMELCNRLISLPIYPAMTQEDIKYVCTALKSVIQKSKPGVRP